MHITPNFLNKKFERLRAFLVVFLAKFFQKINFFQKFLHFWNRLDELVGKMVLFFHFDELHILAFLALDCLKSNFKMKIYAQDTRNKLKMNYYYENILTFYLYTLQRFFPVIPLQCSHCAPLYLLESLENPLYQLASIFQGGHITQQKYFQFSKCAVAENPDICCTKMLGDFRD